MSRPSWRAALAWAAPAVALLLVTQLVLAGSPGSTQRGTPMAILFVGLVNGLVVSLTTAGLILVYRTTRVINFAQTALGVACATVVFDMVQLTRVPFLIVLPLGLAVAAFTGALFELVLVRRFFHASRLVLTVATIAAASLLAQLGPVLARQLPFVPYQSASAEELAGTAQVRSLLPLPGFRFEVGDLPLTFGFPELFAIEAVVLSLLALTVFLRFTRVGVAVRALADNAERASLLGISVGRLSLVVWTVAGLLAGITAICTGAVSSPGQAQGYAPAVLLPALTAAVLAGFRSLPVGVFASVLIGIALEAAGWSLRDDTPLVRAALFGVILAALLVQRARSGRSEEESGGVMWQAVDEPRPVPKVLSDLGSVRAARYALAAAAVLLVLAYPYLVGTGPTVLGGNVAITGIVVLSLVVLTGWSGQVSLGQYGLVAIGAVVGGALTAEVGVPFWIAVVVASAVTSAFAVLVGIPALRIRGLLLAVTTFAFSLAVVSVLFNERYFDWLLPDDVERPTLLFFDFEDERSMYFLCAVCLLVAVAVVANLRRSRVGRILIAVRESEANAASFGIDVVRAKLVAFAVSGALVGFAGVLLAHQGRGVNAESFSAQNSVDIFLFGVLGGISSIPGALAGAAYYNVVNYFTLSNDVLNVVFKASGPLFVVLLLFVAPGGMISIANRVRDAMLRIVAQRHQLVVPSLFADYDAAALERRLIPLDPPTHDQGLAALPDGSRFALASELYHGTGERIADRLTPGARSAEDVAIAAAANSLERAAEEAPA